MNKYEFDETILYPIVIGETTIMATKEEYDEWNIHHDLHQLLTGEKPKQAEKRDQFTADCNCYVTFGESTRHCVVEP